MWRGDINGLPAVAHSFAAQTQQGDVLRGLAAFVEPSGQGVPAPGLHLLGALAALRRPHDQTSSSFERLTDRRYLEVEPKRLVDRGRAPRP